MPSCSILKYVSNNLRPLEHFHHPPLARLEVKCGQWRTLRGDLHLAALHRIFAARSLTCLHLEIKCSERLLAYMLGLAPALGELWLGLSNPYTLSGEFFLAIAAGGRNASVGPPSQTTTQLCRQLRKPHLHYKGWSRGAERNVLIPAFGAIMASHPPEEQEFSFRLSFGEGSGLQEWIIHGPVERFDVELEKDRTYIGVSSPHGIVPLSRASRTSAGIVGPLTGLEYPPLPMESEYITAHEYLELPIDYFFSFHSLKEVRMYSLNLVIGPNSRFSPNTPLFHTLRVLAMCTNRSSPFAGLIFHKLERFKTRFDKCYDDPGQHPLTEMPLCTRLATSLSRLATMKLSRARELDVTIDHMEPHCFWEKHITVNTNLSGLKLLCLRAGNLHWSSFAGTSRIFGSLPALETLVLSAPILHDPPVSCFETFLPMIARGTCGLNRSSWEDQISGVVCPKLESLKIEGIRLTEHSRLVPVLKDIITLRAIIGSPLKSFTFYYYYFDYKKWELVGRDGSLLWKRCFWLRDFNSTFDLNSSGVIG